ncbi:MAG: TrbC/VirB2 family protein [Clostridia bacterium]|nr:TrbC/VirB2 family protein [Clostridia bacterium]
MKLNKAIKILTTVTLVLMLIMTATNVFAITPKDVTPSATQADNDIQAFGGKILSAITTTGIVLSVIVLAVIGIKYMLGSAEEKAEYKKTLMPYIVGAGLIFGASTIATIVYNFMKNA